jgi:hypothetical protein
MSETPPGGTDPGSPLQWTRDKLRGAWNDLRSVYYANTPIWRLLKSAALVFLGLFCWAGANLLLSYRPDWGWLWIVLAYGFLLPFWGPLTHFVVVPLGIRLRRTGDHPVTRWCSRHCSKLNLAIFAVLVVLLAANPLAVMTLQFQLPAGGGGDDVNPQLQCTRSGENVHCHLSDSRGIDHVHVYDGRGDLVVEDREAPFDFDVDVGELSGAGGEKEFTVELRDANDELLRRYRRPVDLIPGG